MKLNKGGLKIAFGLAAAASSLITVFTGCAAQNTPTPRQEFASLAAPYVVDKRTNLCFGVQLYSVPDVYAADQEDLIVGLTDVPCSADVLAHAAPTINTSAFTGATIQYGSKDGRYYAFVSDPYHGEGFDINTLAEVPGTPQVKALVPSPNAVKP